MFFHKYFENDFFFCKNSFTSIYSTCSNLIDMKKVFKKFLTIIFLLTLTAGLSQNTCRWQGEDGANWNDPNNWADCGGYPGQDGVEDTVQLNVTGLNITLNEDVSLAQSENWI